MGGKWDKTRSFLTVMVLSSMLAVAQQQPQRGIPDAPSATKPPQPFPSSTAAPTATPGQPPADQTPPPDQNAPSNDGPGADQPPVPTPNIKTVPEGGATPTPAPNTNSRDQIFTIIRNVNFVAVPVTVKDRNTGRMVDGLLPQDFSVLEDGVKQKLTYFTSDPFFLSAAIVYDLGLPDASVRKINQTFSAMTGAFSQYDQVSVYTYSTAVTRVSDFTPPNQRLTTVLDSLKVNRGQNNGVPVVSGPLAGGPTINGMPAAYSTVRINTNSGVVDVSVAAYRWDPQHIYHFAMLTQGGTGMGAFRSMVYSLRKITPTEAAAIRPRIIHVATVGPGDTVQSLAGRMAYRNFQLDRFLTLNNLTANSRLVPGQKVKLIVYGIRAG